MGQVRRRIAVVDDEESVRKALQRLLRSAGMDVETYSSGAEFLDAMPNGVPDCVVLDLHMPQVSGFEVQAGLAKFSTRVPVVVITGHDTPAARARAIAGGADAYLLKPIDEDLLLDAVAAATSKQSA
ncbi:MAG: response regulator transcription factor [Burkholderiales bacterium]